MLTLLLPGQVMENWKVIKECVEDTLRPDIKVTEELLSNIQFGLLEERAQAWLLYKSDIRTNTSDIRAIALTTITEDFISGFKSLLIYSLKGNFMKDSSNGYKDLWEEGLTKMKQYARENGCQSISFYTNRKAAIALAERVGANIDNIFGYIGVY